MVSKNLVDIKENDLINYDKELLPILLKDNSSKQNIIWATNNYLSYGDGYGSTEPIHASLIIGKNGNIIKPRVSKNKTEQISRIRDKAEVFTPSWICNKQNNLVDNAWFVKTGVFNSEKNKTWEATTNKIEFPENKTWQKYVDERRLEITCGEAPYLVSRYDTVSGEPIDIYKRIGILDRKMRVVNENTESEEEWLKWTERAFQSVYGFEFQGDSLLIARENLLVSYCDYMEDRFHREPTEKELLKIVKIISWNLWQMDGLTYTVPFQKAVESNEFWHNWHDLLMTLVFPQHSLLIVSLHPQQYFQISFVVPNFLHLDTRT